ncbi:MAG: T9SS type A sorting domain-containing protein, partial [Bacteroidia bacterium]|nr:T9SS type A sorting domain-containing protein [Bacteroidia bacterium]
APVSVANLPSGVYFVSVQTSQERILHKFIKE